LNGAKNIDLFLTFEATSETSNGHFVFKTWYKQASSTVIDEEVEEDIEEED
jgi:hypothetical protein